MWLFFVGFGVGCIIGSAIRHNAHITGYDALREEEAEGVKLRGELDAEDESPQ